MAKSKKPDPATGTGTPLSEVVASPPKSANASPPPNGTSQSEDKSSSPPPAPRRSTRRVVKPKPFDSNADFVPAAADSITGAKSSASTNGKKRANPKRKAAGSSLARRPTVPDADLLEEALRPLLQSEIDDWEGWVELESEPAFFNIILHDMGAKDVKAEEIYSLDGDTMGMLPKPVHGLIFLFQYQTGFEEDEEETETGDLWFANQVTQNGCATVALLNIIMNIPDLELGPELRNFKEETQDLDTALKGHRLSTNSFIRSKHNSFTRRIDHLEADLVLENQSNKPRRKLVQKATTTGTKRKAAKAAKGKAGKRVDTNTYAYHFIAYVPSGGFVWELDGLRSLPQKLGPVEEDDWTAIARSQIQARISYYAEDTGSLAYNLIALCQSPLVQYRKGVARAISSLRSLHEKMSDKPDFKALIPEDDFAVFSETAEALTDFKISSTDINNAEFTQYVQEKLTGGPLSVEDAFELHKDLIVDAKATGGEYRSELVAKADDQSRVQGRKRDFGMALHKWVTKLAEKNVLEDMIQAS